MSDLIACMRIPDVLNCDSVMHIALGACSKPLSGEQGNGSIRQWIFLVHIFIFVNQYRLSRLSTSSTNGNDRTLSLIKLYI